MRSSVTDKYNGWKKSAIHSTAPLSWRTQRQLCRLQQNGFGAARASPGSHFLQKMRLHPEKIRLPFSHGRAELATPFGSKSPKYDGTRRIEEPWFQELGLITCKQSPTPAAVRVRETQSVTFEVWSKKIIPMVREGV